MIPVRKNICKVFEILKNISMFGKCFEDVLESVCDCFENSKDICF